MQPIKKRMTMKPAAASSTSLTARCAPGPKVGAKRHLRNGHHPRTSNACARASVPFRLLPLEWSPIEPQNAWRSGELSHQLGRRRRRLRGTPSEIIAHRADLFTGLKKDAARVDGKTRCGEARQNFLLDRCTGLNSYPQLRAALPLGAFLDPFET